MSERENTLFNESENENTVQITNDLLLDQNFEKQQTGINSVVFKLSYFCIVLSYEMST